MYVRKILTISSADACNMQMYPFSALYLEYSLCMMGNLACFWSSADFSFKFMFLNYNLSGISSEPYTDWI